MSRPSPTHVFKYVAATSLVAVSLGHMRNWYASQGSFKKGFIRAVSAESKFCMDLLVLRKVNVKNNKKR